MITRNNPKIDELMDQMAAAQRMAERSPRTSMEGKGYLAQVEEFSRKIDAARQEPASPAVAQEWADALRATADTIGDREVRQRYVAAAEILDGTRSAEA